MNPFVGQAPFRLRRSLGAAYRRSTQSRRALPGILVIGTIKGGTSSLFRWIVQHPQVAPAATGKKELRFFDSSYGRGLHWYRAQYPLASKLASGDYPGTGPGARSIDATPNYLFHPLAAQRAGATVPHARVVALLRNPVERALSHYAMNVKVGREELALEDALEQEAARIEASLDHARQGKDDLSGLPIYELYSYVSRGLYAEQLRRWFAAFSRDQVLLVRSEDLFADPVRVGGQIVEFLELDAWDAPTFPLRNAGDAMEIAPATRRSLEARFEEPNAQLAELVGISW